MDGDLITGFDVGIRATDVSAANTSNANVDAIGVTVYGNTTTDIRLDSATLTLDSSIVGSSIVTTGRDRRRRGRMHDQLLPRAYDDPGGNGCADFQTSAAPAFVDPSPLFGEPDLHLTAGSPMIDTGTHWLHPPMSSTSTATRERSTAMGSARRRCGATSGPTSSAHGSTARSLRRPSRVSRLGCGRRL